MNRHMKKYAANVLPRMLYTGMFLLIFIPSIVIAFAFGRKAFDYIVFFDGIAFYFLICAQKLANCPRCNEYPGMGWRVKQCKACGIKLSE